MATEESNEYDRKLKRILYTLGEFCVMNHMSEDDMIDYIDFFTSIDSEDKQEMMAEAIKTAKHDIEWEW